MFKLILQETGTLSIGRYSGELKAGQIFSGGNLLERKLYRYQSPFITWPYWWLVNSSEAGIKICSLIKRIPLSPNISVTFKSQNQKHFDGNLNIMICCV